MPAKSLSNAAVEMSDIQLSAPDFKAETLLSLTEKIKANLNKQAPEKAAKAPHVRSKKGRKTHKVTNGPKSEPLSSPVTKPLQKKKRLRDGQVKGQSNNSSSANSVKIGEQPGQKVQAVQSELEHEVLALGGTMEDYELVAVADSNSEMEGDDTEPSKNSRKSLEKDLLIFVRDLGIDKVDAKEEGSLGSEQEDNTLDKNRKSEPLQTIRRPTAVDKSLQLKGKLSHTSAPSHLVCYAFRKYSAAADSSLMKYL